jgi:hypothetical protein
VAQLSLDQAVEAIGKFQIVSTATISRLESLTEIPLGPRQRRNAFVACLVYGVDPAELGLSPDGLPLPGAVGDALRTEYPARSTRSLPSTKWYRHTLAAA